MLVIPLAAVPSQTVNVNLRVAGTTNTRQQARITVRTIGAEMYFSLDGVALNRIIRDRQRLLVDAGYRGFIGDFAMIYTQGRADPVYSGLGGRYQLVYFDAGE
jgi:hypothetical protein